MRIQFLGYILFAANFCYGQASDSAMNKTVIEQIEDLTNHNCIQYQTVFIEEDTPDSLKCVAMLDSLPYSSLKKMYERDHLYLKLYAFRAMCNSYPTSISEVEKLLFSDTTRVRFCDSGRIQGIKITVGQLTMHMYNKAIHDIEIQQLQNQVEDSVSHFIMKYSVTPASYESISFQNYRAIEEETIEDIECFSRIYEIEHKYRMIDKSGKKSELTHWFILTNDFRIALIEEKRSKIIIYFDLEIQKWLDRLGKDISSKEMELLEHICQD